MNSETIKNFLAVAAGILLPGLGHAFELRWYRAGGFFFGAFLAWMIFAPAGVVVYLWSVGDIARLSFFARRG